MERTIYNIEFEQVVLGKIFAEPESYWEAFELGLRNYHFADAIHDELYKQLDKKIPAGIICSPDTIKGVDKEYLIKLLKSSTAGISLKMYTKGIIDNYDKDVIKNAVSAIDYEEGVKDIREKILENIITSEDDKHDLKCSTNMIDDVLTEILDTNKKTFFTGYSALDNIMRGITPGELIVVSGRTGMGKTTFSLNLTRLMSKSCKVAFFSMEMNTRELLQKLAAAKTSKPLSMFDGAKTVAEAEFIKDSMIKASNKNMFLDTSPKLSVKDIKTKIMKQKKRAGVDVVIVDYVGLIKKDKRISSVAYQIEEITKELKVIAKELDVAVILLAQMNRATEAEKNKRPILSGLRDSGSLEQDANTVLLLYRPYYYLQRELEKEPNNMELQTACAENEHIFEVIVAKNRKGALGTAKLTWHAECQKIT